MKRRRSPTNSNDIGQEQERYRSRKGGDMERSHRSSESLDANEESPSAKKEEPNFRPSGLLVQETNTLHGVLLKYQEPPEAGIPKHSWRVYVFKGKEQVDMFKLCKQSAYLLGRERKVVDIPMDHPSCSKQHAAIQFRRVETKDGEKVVRPYIIDLESANGTFLNGKKLDCKRYYQLLNKDKLKFGASTREYVIIQED